MEAGLRCNLLATQTIILTEFFKNISRFCIAGDTQIFFRKLPRIHRVKN